MTLEFIDVELPAPGVSNFYIFAAPGNFFFSRKIHLASPPWPQIN